VNLCHTTGSSKKGVALYRNADVLLRAWQGRDQCFVVVCKVCSLHTIYLVLIIVVCFDWFLPTQRYA